MDDLTVVRNILEVKVETKFSIDKFPRIFSKMYEKWKIFTCTSIKNHISILLPMPNCMYFYDIWLRNYLRLNFSLLMFHLSNTQIFEIWEKSQFFWFFAIFFDNIHKIQNILFLWIRMVILHPILRLKAETPYFIMSKYLGSKSGNKIFYW